MEKQNREKRKERRRTNTDAERQIQREKRRPKKVKDEKKQRREEKPRDPKQATIFNFASCTGKFFISFCFAIIIAWVLYIGQFNSLLTGLCMHV